MAGPDEDFLSRWSRRKRAIRAGAPVEAAPPAAVAVPARVVPAATPGEGDPESAPLQAVEELTPESDFKPFMETKVDPGTRREALKKLFADPRYNVMDGLDTYIDDYSIPDPLPADWLGKIAAMSGLGDVPARLEAEREARERAEREAKAPESDSTESPAAQGGQASPTESANPVQAETGVDADEGQFETPVDPAGCATPSIPARKLGD